MSEARRWSPADATRTLVCEACGASFGCTTGVAGSCWCAEEAFRLPVPLPPGVGPYGECLCPDCLRNVAAELAALTGRAI